MSHETVASSGEKQVDSPVSTDALFDVLSHEYRRHALDYLHDHTAVPRQELIGHIASTVEEDESQIALLFHHIHLPKMKDAGVISHDEGTVELTTVASTRLNIRE